MNNDLNYDKLVRAMKRVDPGEIEAAPAVMGKIRAHRQRNGKPCRRSWKAHTWVAAVVMFFAAAVSVNGSVTSFLFEWNGIEVTTYKPEPEQSTAWHAKMTQLEIIDHELKNRPAEWKTLTLEEAQKEWPVPLLRPANSDRKPSRTFGVAATSFKKPAAADDVYIGGFYDIFEQGKEWIVISQNFEHKHEGERRAVSYYPEDWELVKVDDRIMSIFRSGGPEASLELQMRMDNVGTMYLTLSGNVPKKELVKLAEAYIGTKLNL